jgi:hypothetical protein
LPTLNKGMEKKRTRTKRRIQWLDKHGRAIDYHVNPNILLAQTMQWQYNHTGYTYYFGPEPDNISVAFLSHKPLDIDLDFIYHVRPSMLQPYWINFGYHNDPINLVREIYTRDWIAYWINAAAKPLREYRQPAEPAYYMARDIPQGERWRYIEQISE